MAGELLVAVGTGPAPICLKCGCGPEHRQLTVRNQRYGRIVGASSVSIRVPLTLCRECDEAWHRPEVWTWISMPLCFLLLPALFATAGMLLERATGSNLIGVPMFIATFAVMLGPLVPYYMLVAPKKVGYRYVGDRTICLTGVSADAIARLT